MKYHKGPQKNRGTDEDIWPKLKNPYVWVTENRMPDRDVIRNVISSWQKAPQPSTTQGKQKKKRSRPKQREFRVETMGDLKQKIIMDGLVSWPSIGAWTIGSTLFMAGWAVGSVLTGFVGFGIFSGGVAWSLTSLAWRYESIKSKVMAQMKEFERAEKDRQLDELDQKLTQDKDPRDQDALRDLRIIYDEFEAFAEEGKIPEHVRNTMRIRINDLFAACILNLRICYDLWVTARDLRGNAKKQLLENREKVLQDVIKSVETFTNVVTAVMTLSCKNGELSGVSAKLDSELAICLKVEQQLRELDSEISPSYEEYLH